MNPVSEDIKDYLESSSVSLATFGTDLFISELPDKPNLCICLRDTTNFGRPETNGSGMEYPGLQILIRGAPTGYLAAYSIARSIQEELHITSIFELNSTTYISITCEMETTYIGRDKLNRPLFSMNFKIVRKP